MEKQVAMEILQDIRNSLNNDTEQALKTIEIYKRNLEIAENQKIKKLINKQKEYTKKYGENGRKTIKVNKKIDKKIRKINKWLCFFIYIIIYNW